MRKSGMVDEASVAFSIATSQMDEESYAMFGAYNSDQVVGGESGLLEFPNFQNDL